jgi:hexosaminidase
MPDYLSFNNQLRKGSVLWYEAFFRNGNLLSDENALQSLTQLEHWLKPLEGREKIQFDYTSKLIELPDLKSPGSWSKKYKDLLDRAIIEMNNYKNLSERFTELYNTSKRNRYYWSLSKALYDLQSNTPNLLLALKECDSGDKVQQKSGFENVKRAMNDFQKVWTEVQLVYEQTRFVAYPANYIPDRYFHLASQREDLTWMIQAQEIYFGMIKKWLQNKP